MAEFHKRVLILRVRDLASACAMRNFTERASEYRMRLWADIYAAIDALITAVRAEALAEYELKAGRKEKEAQRDRNQS